MHKRRDIIWAAGFLDGEGCFTIKRCLRPKKEGKMVFHQPWIGCGMAYSQQNEQAIQKLQELFGGYTGQWRQTGNRKDTITWGVVSRQAYLTAKRLHNYLVVKKPQSELILEFCEKWTNKIGQSLSPEQRKVRENYYWRLREFNHKGRLRLQRPSEETPKGEATA